MNRRDFIKFLGKTTVATGLATLVGLPEVSDGILYLGRMSDEQWRSAKGEWDGMTLDHQSRIITLDEYAKIIDINLSNPLLPNADSPCTFNGLDEYITTGHGLSS